PGVTNITRLAARSMNPVFAPLNIVRPFHTAQHAGRSGATGRDRIGTDYLTALVARHPDPAAPVLSHPRGARRTIKFVRPTDGAGSYGALHLAVTAVGSFFLLAFDPLVVLRQRLLPQLFGIGLFRIGQRACRRSVPTRQAFEEGAQAPHAGSVLRVRRARRCAQSAFAAKTHRNRPNRLDV